MTKWFGEPWPSPDRRAPVCANDADRVPVPVGRTCGGCGKTIWAKDQGVLIGAFHSDQTMGTTPFHIQCMLDVVLGPGVAAVEQSLKEEGYSE